MRRHKILLTEGELAIVRYLLMYCTDDSDLMAEDLRLGPSQRSALHRAMEKFERSKLRQVT